MLLLPNVPVVTPTNAIYTVKQAKVIAKQSMLESGSRKKNVIYIRIAL